MSISSEFEQAQYSKASAMGYHLIENGGSDGGYQILWSRDERVADLANIEDVAEWLKDREVDEFNARNSYKPE